MTAQENPYLGQGGRVCLRRKKSLKSYAMEVSVPLFSIHGKMSQRFGYLTLRFQNILEMERSKKMVTQESYLKERVAKESEKIKKIEKRNDEKEMQEIMSQLMEGKNLNELDIRQLNGMFMFAADKLKKLEKRNRVFNQQDPRPPTAPSGPLPPHPPQMASPDETGQVGGSGGEVRPSIPRSMQELMRDQWFMDTMFQNQNFAGPSGAGGMELPPEFLAGPSGAGGMELPPEFLAGPSGVGNDDDDLNQSWPRIFSP